MHRTTMIFVALMTGASLAAAHHSYSMFDMSKDVTLTGTVQKFEWTNPHSWLWLEVVGTDGHSRQWGVEGQSPNYLRRRGWSKDTVKVGDKVKLVIHPLLNGSNGGMFVSITLPNGDVLRQFGISPPQGASSDTAIREPTPTP